MTEAVNPEVTAVLSIVDEYWETGLVNTAEAIGWIPPQYMPSFEKHRAKLDAFYTTKEQEFYIDSEELAGYANSVKLTINNLIEMLAQPRSCFTPKAQIAMMVQNFWPMEPMYNRLSQATKDQLMPVLERSAARHLGPVCKQFLTGCRAVYLPRSAADLLPLTFDEALGRIAVEHLIHGLSASGQLKH